MGDSVQLEPGPNVTPSADFLASTDVVDWYHPDVQTAAWMLAGGENDPVQVAKRCFDWVRDEIQHSVDFGRTEVTCRASEVLFHGTGFCYAKSHLLAALLRANRIPAGFCYQRLSVNDTGQEPPAEPGAVVGVGTSARPGTFCLHGFNAVWLPGQGWYRCDPRGNRPGVNAELNPAHEQLAFAPQLPGETTLPEILAEPLPAVVDALRRQATVAAVCAALPDLPFAEVISKCYH